MTRPLKLAGAEADREPEGCGDAGDVGAWLEVVVRLCGLPEGERGQVRDELRDHIEGRVRDLMLTGRGEAEAGAEAIGELGDAAELARNLRAARRRPQRRRLMATMIGAAVLAAAGVTAVVWQPGGAAAPVAVFEPKRAPEAAPAAAARISVEIDTTWETFFDEAGRAASLPVVVSWAQVGLALGEEAVDTAKGRPLGMTFKSMTLPSALAMVNEAFGLPPEKRIDWRVLEGSLVFASTGYFDAMETAVVTYDLSGLPNIEAGGEAGTMEQIKATIVKLVEPEAWGDEGGTRATMTEVGTKLFVRAPKRLHAQVEWILGEVRSTGRAGAGAGGEHGAGKGGGARRPEGAEGFPRFASDHKPGERTYALIAMGGEEFRDALDAFFDARPGLKQCDFPRVWEAGDSTLRLAASERQVELGERLRALIDRPANAADGAPGGTRVFALRHADAGAAAAFLNKVFAASPYLKDCPVPRSITVDASTNAVIVGTSAERVEVVGRLVDLVDQPAEGAAGVPLTVREIFGAGEVVRLRYADPAEAAPIVARKMVELAQETGSERVVVTSHGSEGGVLVAGTPTARTRALAMLRELDEVVGRAGRGAGLGGAPEGGDPAGFATLAGLRRTAVPVLSDVPLINRMFTSEQPAPLVIRAEGGLIRVTAPDGTSVETEEIRVAPSGK